MSKLLLKWLLTAVNISPRLYKDPNIFYSKPSLNSHIYNNPRKALFPFQQPNQASVIFLWIFNLYKANKCISSPILWVNFHKKYILTQKLRSKVFLSWLKKIDRGNFVICNLGYIWLYFENLWTNFYWIFVKKQFLLDKIR